MLWQDILIMVGGFVFVIALLPSVFSKGKPAKSTCFMTAAVLSSYVGAFVTLGLFLSAFSTGLTALTWWVLLFQRRIDA